MISLKSLFRSLPVVLAALTAAGTGELRAQNRLNVSPTALTFNYAIGASQPSGQDIQVTSNDTVSYAITPTSSGWLAVTPTPGITAGVAHVSINPAGLVVGTYTGNLRFDANGVTNSPVNVPVTLNVTSGGTSTTSQLVAAPASLAFTAQTGAAVPLSQNVSVTSNTSTAITYTISTSTGTAWLSASANGGTITPGNVTVAVNHAGLPAGTYTGSVILTPTSGGGSAQTVPVSLTVNSTASLTTSATGLTFNFQTGRATPGNQTISIGSSLGTLTFTATASSTVGTWLSIFPSTGTTPAALTVAVNPTGLPVGTYNGNITVTAPGSSNSLSITVTLVVSNSALLNVSPSSVNFQYFGGALPSAVPVSVTSTGDILVYTATVPPGANWLRLNGTTQSSVGGTTPSTFSLSIDPAFLPGGLATANVTIATSGNPTAFVLPVTVNGSSASTISVTPSQLAFSAVLGGSTPTFQSFSVLSNDNTSQQFTLSSTSTNNFLFVQQNQFATPATVNVGINLGAITVAGTYTGTITVTPVNSSSGGTINPAVVTVTLTVAGNTTVTATPASLAFTPAAGNTTPQTQTIQLSSTVTGVNFLASASTTAGNWLSVVANSTGLPATLSVTANPAGLAPGRYDGTITVVTSGGQQPLTIPVTLTVASPATIAVAPASLTFSATAGGAAPAAQTIQVTGSLASTTITASAVANTGGSWLDVNPKSGAVPATLTVSVNPSGLAAGQYTGTISIAGNGASNSPQTINVVLNVTAPTLPLITSVVNAATFSPTAIAPGEIVTIFGTNMGPSAIVGLRLNASGLVDTTLSDTQVLFDGIAAPLVYVSANQIAAIVPYNVFARLSTRVQVVYQGQASTSLELRVVDTAPGIFTLNSQGTGNAAALNQNGTVNGPSNPAIQGQAVVLYLTGEGQTNPQGVNGQVSSGANLKRPLALVSAKIGGIPAIVDYAGSAPGLVSGVLQLNLRVPVGLNPGPAVVEVTIGSAPPVSNATISVQ